MNILKKTVPLRACAAVFLFSTTSPIFCDKTDDLYTAVKANDIAAAEKAVKIGALVNGTHRYSMTPLILAIFSKQIAMVELLIANGADVNWPLRFQLHPHKYIQITPLIAACLTENLELIKIILKAKPNDSFSNHEGQTALKILYLFEAHANYQKNPIDLSVNHNSRNAVLEGYIIPSRPEYYNLKLYEKYKDTSNNDSENLRACINALEDYDAQKKDNGFVCFSCRKAFSDYYIWERHLERCEEQTSK